MSTTQEKLAKLELCKARVEAFVANGGDLNSTEAVPVGMQFVQAFADVAKDLGYDILKPINDKAGSIRPNTAPQS